MRIVRGDGVESLLRYIAGFSAIGRPGLSGAELGSLEEGLKARLPEPLRAFYRRCGGMTSETWKQEDRLPMRLSTLDEAVEDESILREGADTYQPSPDARYLFTDDGSNWAGVFVSGPLAGKWCLLDHDEPSVAPRFRDFDSFAASLVEAAHHHQDWPQMRTDYPLGPASDPRLSEDDLRLSREFLDRFREAKDSDDAVDLMETALVLLPSSEVEALRAFLHMETPRSAKWTAARIAANWRRPELAPDLVECARGANFTLWRVVLAALVACNDVAEAKRVWARGEPSWRETIDEP